MSRDNEETAFPSGPLGDSMTFEDGRTVHQFPAQPGMSLRDWFAGQVASGLVVGVDEPDEHKCADIAYTLSDAMMDRRKKKPSVPNANGLWMAMFIGGDLHGETRAMKSVPFIDHPPGQYHRHFLGLEDTCFKLVYIWSELSAEKVVDSVLVALGQKEAPLKDGVVTLSNADGSTKLTVDDGARRMTIVLDKTTLALLAEGCADCFNALDK